MVERLLGSKMPSNGVCGDPQRNVFEGRLAWMPCREQGFLTVKVLSVDVSKGTALVEKHPEGGASVAAAQAAAEVIFKDSTAQDSAAHCLADASPSGSKEIWQQTGYQEGIPLPCNPRASPEESDLERAGTMVAAPALSPHISSAEYGHEGSPEFRFGKDNEACPDWRGGRGSSEPPHTVLDTPHQSICSLERQTSAAGAKATEVAANDAAAAAAATVIAAFVAAPPVTVLLASLWPYTRPPMPPHPVPDDSASCTSLSAPALLQQLQHRYLRNEIYTYAAHVLLAVNPCKPLPHLYSAHQIVLYKHWKEIARAYRHQNSCEAGQESLVPQRDDSRPKDAVKAILSRLPGVMPIACLPEAAAVRSSPATVPTEQDITTPDPCLKDSCFHEPLYRDEISAALLTAAVAAVGEPLKGSAGRANRPPPHPFVIAEEALRRLVGTQTNQTIVVSGQSGAGKTETSKQLMLFLTHVSAGTDITELNPDGRDEHRLVRDIPLNVSEQRRQLAALTGGVQTLREAAELRNRIVSCNAIFESFGNAATRRNHNSSRIGRLTLLHFDSGGLLRGGSLRTYMLEAARLTAHKGGDRNFHVFYQLLRGASEKERAALHLLRNAEAYRMLQPQRSLNSLQTQFLKRTPHDADLLEKDAELQATADVPLAVDQENFFALAEALTRADFSSKEIDELLRLLAGLLHLSNISFCEDNGGLSELQDADAEDALTWAASLLAFKENELKDLLRCRRVRLKGDLFFTWRNRQQSYSACCSLIKFIYNRIFDQIVQRLNKGFARHMQPQQRQNQEEAQRHKSVGILDIYGFECFGLENGLEQLCINYANEKQQQLFVQRVIEEEIALYTREGIANSAVTAGQRRQKQQGEQPPKLQCSMKKELHESFKASLEQSLFSSLPDTSVLLRDLQEGVFRRLDDSCRLLAQGQQRDDFHFWKDLFAYCVPSTQDLQNEKGVDLWQSKRAEQYLFFCLKGIYRAKAADAAANGHLLQQLQLHDLNSIGLVAADQLVSGRPRDAAGASAAGKAAASKVQERVFAVKHFAGTVVYGTDGWLELNNDRIEYELERLVAKTDNSLLRQAMMQHEASREQEGTSLTTAGGGQFSSITKRFVKSVKDLSQELQGPQMQLHFIRCFIPNRCLRPDNFERKVVLQQEAKQQAPSILKPAARLRESLCPLVRLRLLEQEQTLEHLIASRAHQHHAAADPAGPEDELKKHTRMLQMLRHCNPANVRDQTLVSAALGLLPQCRPGMFICGVSLICFKAAAYGEATELIAEPSSFFRTPEDLCKLVAAIQRMRWRVATCIALHVHPTLLWLQRRAFLMRRIKEETVKVALRVLLLKKHILIPLRKRVKRRLVLRQGLSKLDRLLLQRGFLSLRRYKPEITADGATTSASWSKRGKQPPAKSGKKLSPLMQLGNSRQGSEDDISFFDEHQSWSAFFSPLKLHREEKSSSYHHAALHFGKSLYSVNFHGCSSHPEDHLPSTPPVSPSPLRIQQLLGSECFAPITRACQLGDQLGEETARCGEGTAPRPRGSESSLGPHIVSVAKHPSYTDLFLACTSTAQLLLFDTVVRGDSSPGEEEEIQDDAEALIEDFLALTGVPSTALPPLNSPSARLDHEAAVHSEHSACRVSMQKAEGRPQPSGSLHRLPPLPAHVNRCAARPDRRFPPGFLRKTPIQPKQWLPKDLIQLLASEPQQKQQSQQSVSPRVPTVRPLRVSFAHHNTADYALVLCHLQRASSGDTDAIEKLAVVLVDLIAQCSAGWLPLAFSLDSLCMCARQHSTHLRHLRNQFSSETSSSKNNGGKSSGAKHTQLRQSQQLNARSMSNLLSSVQLKPLWGDKWIIVGPALLALFSVDLRLLQHPPEDARGQGTAHTQPMVLLWNLASIPNLKGMSFEVARAWFTACTYVRVPPPGLRHASGSEPLVQFLQVMPHGPVARSLDAKMQRLLLLSTADNKLLLMQWSERPSCCGPTGAGNLVLLDQVQLPYSVLQFLREAPAEDLAAAPHERPKLRLIRAFPWESDALMPRRASKEAPNFHSACNEEFVESDVCTTSGSSDVGSGGLRTNQQLSVSRTEGIPDLRLNFPSYGIAIVKRSCTGSVTRSLCEQAHPSHERSSKQDEGHVVTVTALPSRPGLLASIVRKLK
ncbi:hypothetical protein Emed_001081 [Eimeria media]